MLPRPGLGSCMWLTSDAMEMLEGLGLMPSLRTKSREYIHCNSTGQLEHQQHIALSEVQLDIERIDGRDQRRRRTVVS